MKKENQETVGERAGKKKRKKVIIVQEKSRQFLAEARVCCVEGNSLPSSEHVSE